jgi:hypothetical protein
MTAVSERSAGKLRYHAESISVVIASADADPIPDEVSDSGGGDVALPWHGTPL